MEKEKIETKRVVLRKFRIDDADDMFKNYTGRDVVTKYLRWMPHKSKEDTRAFLKNVVLPKYESEGCYVWAIELKELNEVIGCVEIAGRDLKTKKCTFGCVIGDAFWGKGLMTEIGREIVKLMFEEGFVRIQSHVQLDNIASKTMLKKLGFEYEGTLKKYDVDRYGNIIDCEIYGLIK